MRSSFQIQGQAGHGGEHLQEPAEEKQMEPVWENVNFRKHFEDHSPRDPQPTEEQIREILRMTNKLKPETS